jgi:GH15 family glucan-1,4-alpha-glucosidase
MPSRKPTGGCLSQPIENYALIGDCHTAALVGKDGSIDWLCFPRFDSGACFAALLGTPEHGRWLLAPVEKTQRVERRYVDDSLILQTDFETAEGVVRITDFMPASVERWDVVRIVEALKGTVRMRMELVVRFDYGSIVPWARRIDGVLDITAGPDTLELSSSVEFEGENMKTVAEFSVAPGQSESFILNYRPSHRHRLVALNAQHALKHTALKWHEWSGRTTYQGRWHAEVQRSLITLKALTYYPTGGMVAAPTTSLPEQLGSVRNWDYRYCWLRDATFTLNALLLAGYAEEAKAWREWLVRAIAGSPDDLQILYSVTGVRRLDEVELPWLPGYESSAPVRVGNAAAKQFQLDVYGEVMDSLHLARLADMKPHPIAWQLQVKLLEFLEAHWDKADEGLWEMRGPPRHFTHSKIMVWVAFDRAIKDAEANDLQGPLDRWRELRDSIHSQICRKGFSTRLNSFVQSYDAEHLDASLLLIPQVGFLPADDPRFLGTVAAIESNLVANGLVLRYSTESRVDALPPGEGAFLPCSFWLADSYVMTGRREEGEALFERLLTLSNDLGLYAEEYDPVAKRMLGNFPQALTHMALINTARLISLPSTVVEAAGEQGERPATVGT